MVCELFGHLPSFVCDVYCALNCCFVLCVGWYQLECDLGQGVSERSVTIYLTSLRLVFVPERVEEKFGGLEVPLATLPDGEFNQPIFGANNLTGTAPPV